MRNFLFSAAMLISGWTMAQSLNGKITHAETDEPLAGAHISIAEKNISTQSSRNGQFYLKADAAGSYTLNISFIGFETLSKSITLKEGLNTLNFSLQPSITLLDPVNVATLRAAKETPIAKSNLSKEQIEAKDDGRDIPYILKDLPSTVVSSDAGAGIGYTGIRIRGSDITRINVTVNGIPLNDPESQGVFFVNTPDLISSTQSIQVQRGVGTSTNGGGAFGASINLKTTDINAQPSATTEFTAGSFNTLKTNLNVSTGLLNKHWVFEGRVSKLTSDGFIDRASADLKSYYLSGSYYAKNTSVQLIHFGGGQETYQAWYGVPEVKLKNDAAGIEAYIVNNGLTLKQAENLRNANSRSYNFYDYDNEVDHYDQDHYQLHFSHRFSKHFKANAALHYTYGRGYFEQYKNDEDFADYNLDTVFMGTDTLANTDLIRRRWLDNHFAGATYSLEYHKSNVKLILGGAYNRYEGDHFGEIIWARNASQSEIRDRYYDNTSIKTDFNVYTKAIIDIEKFSLFGDLQYRKVDYSGKGIDSDQLLINLDENFNFFNPKAGLNYNINKNNNVYASVAIGQREPVRNDFLDALPNTTPKSEFMVDYELGYNLNYKGLALNFNYYYMDYKDQLVLTGELNDVGSSIRTNVPESYRTGIEIDATYLVNNWLNLGGNLAFSENKILNFTNYIPDGISYQTTTYEKTDISFSPNLIMGGYFSVMPVKNFEINWNTKFVGQQYLDNTSTASRSISDFTVTDLRLSYNLKSTFAKNINFNLLVANLFDVDYAPNGFTYSYIRGSKVTDNHYFPMAGMNFLGGVKISF